MSASTPGRPADRRRLQGAAIVLLAVLLVAVAVVKPNPFSDPQTIHAVFDDATGLAPIGADVRMAGTPVGKITGRRRVGDDADLELQLGDDAPTIRSDARAQLRPRLLFEGTAYVELQPGSPSAPPLTGALPRSRTSTYVSLSDAIGVLGGRSKRGLQGSADGLARTLTARPQRDVQALIRRAPKLTATVARTASAARGTKHEELRSAIGGLHRTVAAVAARSEDLGAAPAALARTAGAADRPALGAAIAQLPATERRLVSGSAALEATVRTAKPLLTELRPAARRLEPALTTARPLLRKAGPALAKVTPVLRDGRATLQAARPAAAPARQLLARLTPTLDVLDGSFLPEIAKPTTLGTPAYLAFLGLFAGGGGASRPIDSGGHFMRFGLRFLTGVGQPVPSCSLLEQVNKDLADQLASAGACTS